MGIIKNITVELSENDVKIIIADYFQREGHKVSKDDISIVIGSRLEEYGMSEHTVNYFEGAYVKMKIGG